MVNEGKKLSFENLLLFEALLIYCLQKNISKQVRFDTPHEIYKMLFLFVKTELLYEVQSNKT